MALIKEIVLDNGITVNYHRIVSINNIINQSSIIEVASYTSKAKREEEQNALKNAQSMNVYIDSDYKEIPYDEKINVESAYAYIKTLDKFKNSKDD